MTKLIALTALAFTLLTSAWAATQTVRLAVPGMTCAACPITVKKALTKVDGVQKAVVSYEKREVVVTFDDAETSTSTLTQATENAGYPATVKP